MVLRIFAYSYTAPPFSLSHTQTHNHTHTHMYRQSDIHSTYCWNTHLRLFPNLNLTTYSMKVSLYCSMRVSWFLESLESYHHRHIYHIYIYMHIEGWLWWGCRAIAIADNTKSNSHNRFSKTKNILKPYWKFGEFSGSVTFCILPNVSGREKSTSKCSAQYYILYVRYEHFI